MLQHSQVPHQRQVCSKASLSLGGIVHHLATDGGTATSAHKEERKNVLGSEVHERKGGDLKNIGGGGPIIMKCGGPIIKGGGGPIIPGPGLKPPPRLGGPPCPFPCLLSTSHVLCAWTLHWLYTVAHAP